MSLDNSKLILNIYPSLNLLNLRAFKTTDTELNAIAPPAIAGVKNPIAANGIPIVLYIKAQNKF
jgi:hypothetical protein